MRHEVTDVDTALALGSGDVPVLATPRLIAWMEAATVGAAQPYVGAGQTTVGTSVHVEHRSATLVGGTVTVDATLAAPADARRLRFRVTAVDEAGRTVADGEIDRALVDRDRFLERP